MTDHEATPAVTGTDEPERGTVAYGRRRWQHLHGRPAITDRTYNTDDLTGDPMLRGEVHYAARRGNRSAAAALAHERAAADDDDQPSGETAAG